MIPIGIIFLPGILSTSFVAAISLTILITQKFYDFFIIRIRNQFLRISFLASLFVLILFVFNFLVIKAVFAFFLPINLNGKFHIKDATEVIFLYILPIFIFTRVIFTIVRDKQVFKNKLFISLPISFLGSCITYIILFMASPYYYQPYEFVLKFLDRWNYIIG